MRAVAATGLARRATPDPNTAWPAATACSAAMTCVPSVSLSRQPAAPARIAARRAASPSDMLRTRRRARARRQAWTPPKQTWRDAVQQTREDWFNGKSDRPEEDPTDKARRLHRADVWR